MNIDQTRNKFNELISILESCVLETENLKKEKELLEIANQEIISNREKLEKRATLINEQERKSKGEIERANKINELSNKREELLKDKEEKLINKEEEIKGKLTNLAYREAEVERRERNIENIEVKLIDIVKREEIINKSIAIDKQRKELLDARERNISLQEDRLQKLSQF